MKLFETRAKTGYRLIKILRLKRVYCDYFDGFYLCTLTYSREIYPKYFGLRLDVSSNPRVRITLSLFERDFSLELFTEA
jgi:hypothetical protein|tara:strand:+ start:999 stop:1235 length:237 start_codon:yes stop_codon:yes gene_type:complete